MRPQYTDLYFGKSDSRNERRDDKEDFVRSYVDLNQTVSSVVAGEQFIVLGPKGTGKSALGWYLEATEYSGSYHALIRDASMLPLAEVPRLQTGQAAGPERSVSAWTFILLCNYLELLMKDPQCSIRQAREAHRVADILRDFGFIGSLSGRALERTSNVVVEIPVPKQGRIYRREGRPSLNIYNLIPYLESWAIEAQSDGRHVLVIDGLDSIFLNDSLYDDSLSSLVQAAYLLNQKMAERDASGSIVLLLRNDVFSRVALTLPDSQKMRDDLSLDLDWRILSGAKGITAPLVQLVNAKAARALDVDQVSVLDYFPHTYRVGGRNARARDLPMLSYLLNLTRHTPRDLLRLFEEIRRVQGLNKYSSDGYTISEEVLREGVAQYSSKYFVGAIHNEFAGADGGPALATAAVGALKNLGKHRFSRDEFRLSIAEFGINSAGEVDKLLKLLFFAGAIGNQRSLPNESYLQFYHRRDEAQIYLAGELRLHNALLNAWGMPYGSSTE